MNLKILKKDLFKKKSINLILLIFVMLATTFVSSGVTNCFKVMNSLDEFMEISEVSDYVFLALNKGTEQSKENEARDNNYDEIQLDNNEESNNDILDENNKNIREFLDNETSVEEYTYDDFVMASKRNFELEGRKELKINATTIICSVDVEQQNFFDEDNEQITDINGGEIYISQRVFNDNDIAVGDKIKIISDNGFLKEFVVKGYMKDALTGGELMGTYRAIVCSEDFIEIKENAELGKGFMYSVDTDNLTEFKKAYNKQEFSALVNIDINIIKISYIMNMIIAIVIMIVSICLIIISAIMLRFTIIFTINEELKPIGILKAIGIKDRGIRKLFMAKYFVISVIGAVLGFIISIPFGNLLVGQMTDSIVMKNDNKILLQLLLSIIVVLIVSIFTYISTGKIKKLTPMDSIRSGNNGERFKKKEVIKLKGKGIKTTTFMAINDVASEIKKYVILLIVGAVGIWLVIIPANTINTLRSDKIGSWMGLAECDLVLDDFMTDTLIVETSKEAFENYVKNTEKKLNDNGVKTDRVFMEISFRFRIRHDDLSYQSMSLQGINTNTDMYMYDKGTAPKYDNEIAITYIVAEAIDAQIGDTVYIMMNGEEREFVVTAIYQSMNNMGEGIRFSDTAEIDYNSVSGCFALQIDLKGEPDSEKIASEKEKVKEIIGMCDVYIYREYIDSMLGGISDGLDSLKYFILVIVTIINILIVVLMQKMFLIRERGEIGLLKAIGYNNKKIVKWQTKRIALILSIGIVIGTVTSTFMSNLTSGQVFKMMGAMKIEFVINPVEVYIIYPVMIFIMAIISCIITMNSVKKIDVKEVNNIE